MAKSLRDLGKPLTPEEQARLDQEKALADQQLMAGADPVTPDSAEELAVQPVNEPGQLTRVAVPAVTFKAPPVPEDKTPLDFSSVGGHVDPMPVDAPAYDFTGAVHQSREDADQMRLAAGLGRAGQTVNAALGGYKADPSAYDSLEQQAKAVEARPGVDLKLDEMSRKYRLAQALKDPNHPVNQKARAATPKAFAAMLGDNFNRMTADELSKQFPVLREALKFATADEKAQWSRQMDAFKMQNSAAKDQAILAGQADQRNINAFTAQNMPARSDEVVDRFKITRTDNLAKDTGKFSEIGQTLKLLNQQVPGIIHGKLPKDFSIGARDRLAMALPSSVSGVASWVATPEGQKFKNLLTTARDLVQRGRSGAVLNEGEEKFYIAQFADSALANPQAIATNLGNLTKLIQARMKDRQSSAGVGGKYAVLQDYEGGGGFTYNDPIFTPPQEDENPSDVPAPAPSAPPAATSGMVRVRYPQDPSGTVYVIPADKVGKDGSVAVEE